MKASHAALFRCPRCSESGLALRAFDLDDDRCREGVLVCEGCSTWYPISGSIVELLPAGAEEPGRRERFAARHRSSLEELGLSLEHGEGNGTDADFSAQIKQREHFDELARRDDELSYTSSVGHAPFWRVVREDLFAEWNRRVRPGSVLLDIGCADGLSTFPMARAGNEILAFDISRESLVLAQSEAESEGLRNVTFFVADADAIPVRAESIDCVTCFGSLHHVPDPGRTLAEAERVLKTNGQYLGVENNKTPLRPIFDLMMRIRPIWKEEAGAEALIGEADLKRWTESSSLRLTSRAIVFAPPHLCNRLSLSGARRLLHWTQAVLRRIPLIRRWGGLLAIYGEKASSAGSHQDPNLRDLTEASGDEVEAGA